MPIVHLFSEGIDDTRRGTLIYRGDFLIFKNLGSLQQLCERSRQLAREFFRELAPESAQFEMDPETYSKTVASLQETWKGDAGVKELLFASLAEAGVDRERNFRDWLYLRVLPEGPQGPDGPNGNDPKGRHLEKIAPHRDTWASNLMQQTNWWTPIYPVTDERTIAFFPEYWSRPIDNTSASWEADGDAPLPLARTAIDPKSELRLVIDPGDLLCFSGAHLHASVPNTSGATRFSTEIRTVNVDDVRASLGAPNVDGANVPSKTNWFKRLSDGKSLTAALQGN